MPKYWLTVPVIGTATVLVEAEHAAAAVGLAAEGKHLDVDDVNWVVNADRSAEIELLVEDSKSATS